MNGDVASTIDEAAAEGRLTEDRWDAERASKFLSVPIGLLAAGGWSLASAFATAARALRRPGRHSHLP